VTVAVRQEYPIDRLALGVKCPSGKKGRWAEDEALAANVLSDMEPSGEMPGGWKDMAGTLARDPRRGWDDIEAFSEFKLTNIAGKVIFEGSLDKAPDVSGDQMSMAPSALGYQSILGDGACQIGIIDSDISRFTDPSSSRRLGVLSAGAYSFSQEVNVGFQDEGTVPPGIFFTLGDADAEHFEIAEQWAYYDGVDIGAVMFDFISNFGFDATYLDQIIINQNDQGGAVSTSGNYSQIESLHQRLPSSGTAAAGGKYIAILCQYAGAAVGEHFKNCHGWVNLRVLGRHGMEIQGTWPEVGFTTKQCIEYIVNGFANPLSANPANIEDDGFIIPQAWYGAPAPPEEALKDVTKYGLWDWFVYRGKEVEYRQPGSYGKFWKSWVSESELNEVGLDSQRLWSSIIVSYTDVNGSTKTVGPPASEVKSGDWISFVDAADNDYRKIVGHKYSHSNKANAIDVDAPSAGLEALLERLQAGLISLGVS
jgi:hypothetical protein